MLFLTAFLAFYYNIILMKSINLEHLMMKAMNEQKLEYKRKFSEQLFEILENLEEGIVMFNNEVVDFTN